MSRDYNAMSNGVPVLNQPADKTVPHNNRYNTTCTRNRIFVYNEDSESEINILVPSYNFSDSTNKLILDQSDDNLGATIRDDIIYESMPGILIFCVVNDDGGAHNIEVENAVEITSDEIRVNFNSTRFRKLH
jgi:hypothetical protein